MPMPATCVADWRSIGVIGGMGPAATADFMARLVAGVPATCDEDHPRVLIESNPHVPDRNAALAGQGPSPGPALAAVAQRLAASGAELLAMPCNAAHGWADDICAATPLPFISMIDAAAAVAAAHRPAAVGLMAVGATLDAGLYHRALAGITVINCDPAIIQPLVSAVKAGDTGPAILSGVAVEAARLVAAGAQVIIAACTELPLVLGQGDVAVPLVDATSALVDAVLAAAKR